MKFSIEHFEPKPSAQLKFLHILKVRTLSFFFPQINLYFQISLPYENTCLVLTIVKYVILSHF